MPNQFIAKMYTEALGRAPDQGGWQWGATYFSANGCSHSTLRSWGRFFYNSAEYASRNYDNASKVLTLYRGILSREPDQDGLNYWRNRLDSGYAFSRAVDDFFNSAEFRGLVSSTGGICAGGAYRRDWARTQAPTLPTTGSGFQGGTGAQLQTLIDSAAPGTTVYLAQKAVVWLEAGLTIKSGVTLATSGPIDRFQYAKMARVVRRNHFDNVAVVVESGAQLVSVWVDGNAGVLGRAPGPPHANIQAFGQSTVITTSRSSDSTGWSTLVIAGSRGYPVPCAGVRVTNNLTTGYANGHYVEGSIMPWTDGISVQCGDALIEGNHIVDPTDVGIVLFAEVPPVIQRSVVRQNVIVSAGHAAYGALALDNLVDYPPEIVSDFSGAHIANNTFWTGSTTHFDIALAVGSRAWWGDRTNKARNASVTGNTVGALSARVDTGISVSGMLNATVQNNTGSYLRVNPGRCPDVNVAAAISAGWASGIIQPYTDMDMPGCIGH